MNLQELPTSVLIAWDSRIKSDLEVFGPMFIPPDGEPARTWRRYREDIRAGRLGRVPLGLAVAVGLGSQAWESRLEGHKRHRPRTAW